MARTPCRLAWQEIDVPQCGYCQAGQMMSAAALLAKTPKPTDKEIDSAHERQSLPLRNLYAHPRGRSQGRRIGRQRTPAKTVSAAGNQE